jgi:hypothetical protein
VNFDSKTAWLTAISGAVVYVAVWAVAVVTMAAFFEHSEAREAYGVITAWWASLLVAYIGRFHLKHLSAAAVIFLGLFCLDVALGKNIIYRDYLELISLEFVALSAGRCALFISPVVIALAIRKGEQFFGRHREE